MAINLNPKMVEPTPRPWENRGRGVGRVDHGWVSVCNTSGGTASVDRANAAHIVKCVNNHERLVAIVERLGAVTPRDSVLSLIAKARALLAGIEKET